MASAFIFPAIWYCCDLNICPLKPKICVLLFLQQWYVTMWLLHLVWDLEVKPLQSKWMGSHPKMRSPSLNAGGFEKPLEHRQTCVLRTLYLLLSDAPVPCPNSKVRTMPPLPEADSIELPGFGPWTSTNEGQKKPLFLYLVSLSQGLLLQ